MSKRMNKERAKEIINTEVIEPLKSHQQMSACFDYDDDGNAKPNNNYAYYDELLQALHMVVDSLDELTRLNQHITSLAHYWREKDDKAFKERLQVIEQEYRAKGKEDLAEYIRVQYSDCMCWVPM